MLRKDPFITGEYYHLYNRGIDKRVVFKSASDFERFLMLLYVSNTDLKNFRLDNLINQQNKKFHEILMMDKSNPLISIGVWCLMTNHFHLLVRQEVDGGITKFMKKLGTGYSMYFNIKYERQGALFGGPFKSKLIGVDDNYMRHLFGYIHLNPLDNAFSGWEDLLEKPTEAMKKFLESYRYSSYLDYISGGRIEERILNMKSFPEYFDGHEDFKDFVESYFTRSKQGRNKQGRSLLH